MNRFGVWQALARRELIENRNSLILAPAILVALMVVLIGGSLTFGIGETEFQMAGNGMSAVNFAELLNQLDGKEPGIQAGAVATFLSLLVMPALFVLPIVIFFLLLGGLYEERRDRSFLFWKSMPVSDTQEVLARLGGGILLAPAILLACGIAGQLAMMLLATVVGGLQGGAVGVIWQLPTMLQHWLHGAVFVLVWMIWALPVFAWVLLAGAYAPRTPFFYAVLPPVVLGVLERIFLKSSYLADWIGKHLTAGPLFAGQFRSAHGSAVGENDFEGFMAMMASPDWFAVLRSFANLDLWFGALIAAALIFAAIRLRRYSL